MSRHLFVTPFVAAVIPTHHYETRGHTAVGRDLRELQVGVNVGRDLEEIIPRTYFQARYSYAFVQNVEQFGLNRSNVDWEFGYYAKPRVSLRFTGAWQYTYSGLRYPLDQAIPDFHELHDRAAKSGFVRFGGRLTVTLRRISTYTPMSVIPSEDIPLMEPEDFRWALAGDSRAVGFA
jgi:hypothetical protein